MSEADRLQEVTTAVQTEVRAAGEGRPTKAKQARAERVEEASEGARKEMGRGEHLQERGSPT